MTSTQIAILLRKEGLKLPSKALNAQAREARFLTKLPLAWKVQPGAVKGWRDPKEGYTVRPFKDTGEHRYNPDGAWALPRKEAPITGEKAKTNIKEAKREARLPRVHGAYHLSRKVGGEESLCSNEVGD